MRVGRGRELARRDADAVHADADRAGGAAERLPHRRPSRPSRCGARSTSSQCARHGAKIYAALPSRLPPMAAVELHMVSDATGETAQRLVQALEAQFPEQEFLEIRHPRVEIVADLQLAVDRMKGRPAVVVYTLVEPELREAMRDALPEREAPLLRPARPSDRGDREGVGAGGEDEAGRAAAAERRVLPPHVGDRVRGQVRRRPRRGPCARPTSCSSASRAPRRRRSRSTSATSATRRRTCRSSRGSSRRRSCSRSTSRRSSA